MSDPYYHSIAIHPRGDAPDVAVIVGVENALVLLAEEGTEYPDFDIMGFDEEVSSNQTVQEWSR